MEKHFLTPMVLEFKSEKSNEQYYRLGDRTKKLNTNIYRVFINDFNELTEKEKEELINQNHLISNYNSYGKEDFIIKILEYCNK